MKVCVISSTVFACGSQGPGGTALPGYGGLEVVAWEVARGLAARGHQVSLVAPNGSYCPGVEIIHTGPPGGWGEQAPYGGFRYKTGRILKNEQGQDYEEEATVPPYWPRLLDFNDGGCIIDHSWQKYSYMLKAEGRLTAPVLGVLHAPVDTMYGRPPPVEKPCVVCISEDQADHWNQLHNKPTQQCLARVAHNGVDLDFYRPLNVPRTDRFLFVARFSTIKSPAECIDVCKEAGVGLDLIGDVSITNEPGLYELCRAKADGRQIRIVGPASRGNCVWWMSRSRGFLHLNQKFREPFGLAPVEAQACGNGVLCWNWGAMRETVKHGETGFLVKSLNEAVDILRSGELDLLDRGRCREWASRFSVQNMVTRYEQLAQEAIETGGW